MKKLICAMLAGVMAVSFTACAGANTKGGPIAVVVPSTDAGWNGGAAYYAELQCEKLHLKKDKNYQIFSCASAADEAAQLLATANGKYSAVVLVPTDDRVASAAQRVTKFKKPLVICGKKLDVSYNAYLQADSMDAGRASASYLGGKMNGKGMALVVNVLNDSASLSKVGGFKETMQQKYPKIKLIDVTVPNAEEASAKSIMASLLPVEKNAAAIYCTDNNAALGALDAVKAQKGTTIKYIGGADAGKDLLKAIKTENGVTLFTTSYGPSIVKEAVKVAADITNGKTVKKEQNAKVEVITKSNVGSYYNESSPY